MNDENLDERIQALPSAVEPSRDLWRGVAARIEAQNRAKRMRRMRVASGVTTLAIAASIALAFGVQAYRSQASRSQTGARAAEDGGGATPADSIAMASPLIVPDPTPPALLPEEPSYRAAANALRTSLVESRTQLPEKTAIALDADLNLIDAAIEATRTALSKNPDDPNLRAALRDAYQQEIDVLSDLTDLTTI